MFGKKAWGVVLSCLLAVVLILPGCGEESTSGNRTAEDLSKYGIATDKDGDYITVTGTFAKFYGKLVKAEDGSAVFYSLLFERHYDEFGNVQYDVDNEEKKFNVQDWAAAGEPWPDNAPVPLPENAHVANTEVFSASTAYDDNPLAKAEIGELPEGGFKAYVRQLEDGGWERIYDGGADSDDQSAAEIAFWYLGKDSSGVILKKDSVYVSVKPVGSSRIDLYFCYGRLPKKSPLPQPENAKVKWAIVTRDNSRLQEVCFEFSESYGPVEEQVNTYLRSLETNGIIQSGSESRQKKFASVEQGMHGFCVWFTEYAIEKNCMTIKITWRFPD